MASDAKRKRRPVGASKKSKRKGAGVSAAVYNRAIKKMVARMAAESSALKFRKKLSRQHALASAARDRFRPRKAERGGIVMVGRDGKRLPPGSKRKGIPVRVYRTGRKVLFVRRQVKNPYALRPADNIKFPSGKNFRKVVKEFQIKRLKQVGGTKLIRASKARKLEASEAEKLAINKGEKVTPGEFSERIHPKRGKAFDERMVSALAKSIKRAVGTQKRKAVYLITALAEVDGEFGRDVVQIQFSLGRSEQFFFSQSPKHFIKNAFYAVFAQELAYLGYITSGSANHIRRVTGKEVTLDVWEDYHNRKGRAMTWQGEDFNVVDLISLEWKIERT